MFRVRWAEKVLTNDDNFTHMVIPKKTPVEIGRRKKIKVQKEPWVLAKQVP
jgi:hypothetical protein